VIRVERSGTKLRSAHLIFSAIRSKIRLYQSTYVRGHEELMLQQSHGKMKRNSTEALVRVLAAFIGDYPERLQERKPAF
jgi:hypothetical protein